MTSKTLFIVVVAAFTITVVGIVGSWQFAQTPNSRTLNYTSAAHGFSFDYSDALYLFEKAAEAGNIPALALAFVEDTVDSQAFLAGESDSIQEAPPLISVDVYVNDDAKTPIDWIASNTNWIIIDKPKEEITINGSGVLFSSGMGCMRASLL